ncbi:2-hydroxyacid dehydrogenase [Parapusillimonas granuli]|uniref:D-glycerate dehydrogenase n=1 Tax=Parapusillimonas granuli TaxID=380911 RepID=A0A853FYW5_9BURK|nr:D-glycerate dehydrogenase [Parapusillimonas granuli]MBB5215520.1 glyoxylate reductase [Parapusillimonas granuli]MEB2400363.1 D-glycerate dehydrogenase [Alcaligenaceae bacterium]NYT49813.1 D-glycerate dehydrogenase [Parapusillimonas granuli]
MPQPRVIITAPVPADLREQLAAQCEIIDVPTGAGLADALPKEQLDSIEGVVCTVRSKFDTAVFDALPRLRVVSNFAVGYDNINIPEATKRNVLVCNTPKVLDGAVADLTFGLLICLARDLVRGDAHVRSGAWAEKGAPALTQDIRGKTLGLLGMGRIGRVVAETAKAFNMKVIYHNRNRDAEAESLGFAEYRDRDALFAESDFLSIHVPLTPETRHSVGAKEFAAMKPTAYLINTSRGPVVDEAALIDALKAGRIAGAGLDVMEQEPLPASSPLCALPNVVLQAHVGSATVETRRAMIDLAVRNLLDALSGTRPQAMVNPEVWAGASETTNA